MRGGLPGRRAGSLGAAMLYRNFAYFAVCLITAEGAESAEEEAGAGLAGLPTGRAGGLGAVPCRNRGWLRGVTGVRFRAVFGENGVASGNPV
jgi:hypothetical protein